MKKMKLAISSCLLGEKVRYDGQHKHDHYLTDVLGQFVEWVPVCPEVECGMTIPREAMHLSGDIDNPRLVTIHTDIDLTDQMKKWGTEKINFLAKEDLCGYVFKSKSPSSGRFNVKVFNAKGIPVKKGIGIFARMFAESFPLIPQEEEGRLHDPMLRDNFIDKIFAYSRWKDYEKNDGSASGLVNFHSRYKYTIMAHASIKVSELGRMVASIKKQDLTKIKHEYIAGLMNALDYRSTVAKNRNVMLHLMGYFKKHLTPWEKQEILEVIDTYVNDLTPRLTPLTLLRHYARKYNCEYLLDQYYLNPSPEEVMLKYHA
jgi:uncharacterized protein YbgA (DUF1722 family)/uncharacterized protein YbbK (DUF523 family)